ncbi:hypothetical protein PENTCL1PPCAC_20859 [Pristionchus entomophagus]|uniref:Uncharacterized protein n=1 Tax=Pristionchus entomophagus TaxID=358040 RepID=A0AAV5TW06_9BILA|nr:hypothetical protein PENTCL1PPCAC_20859 [Pristionchus entomophagus]
MRNLLINSDWLLSSIMKRLRHTGCGYWEFQATMMIDISEIENSLTTDLEYIHVNKRHCIRIVGTEHHVFFNVERSEYHGNRLMLISNFREGPIDCWLLQSPNS